MAAAETETIRGGTEMAMIEDHSERCEYCDTPLSIHGNVAAVCEMLQEERRRASELYDRCYKLEAALRAQMGWGDMASVDEML